MCYQCTDQNRHRDACDKGCCCDNNYCHMCDAELDDEVHQRAEDYGHLCQRCFHKEDECLVCGAKDINPDVSQILCEDCYQKDEMNKLVRTHIKIPVSFVATLSKDREGELNTCKVNCPKSMPRNLQEIISTLLSWHAEKRPSDVLHCVRFTALAKTRYKQVWLLDIDPQGH